MYIIFKRDNYLINQVATFQTALATDGSTTVFILNYVQGLADSEVSSLILYFVIEYCSNWKVLVSKIECQVNENEKTWFHDISD